MTQPENGYYLLSKEEASFFEAVCALMVPAGEDPLRSPGAIQVGALNYIDSTLVDYPKEMQDYFMGIVKLTNETSRQRFNDDFSKLSDFNKDFILRSLFLDSRMRERMFDLRSLVLESYYSDYHNPSYDGLTAWELIGFGGKRISGIKKDWTFLKIWRDSEERKEQE